MAVLWGMPYLFIKQAVDSYSPASIVAGRTLLGALLLLPFAPRQKALRPACRRSAGCSGSARSRWPDPSCRWAMPTDAAIGAHRPARGHRSALRGAHRLQRRRPHRVEARAHRSVRRIRRGGLIVVGPGLASRAERDSSRSARCCSSLSATRRPVHRRPQLDDVPALGTMTLSLSAVGLFYLPIAFLLPTRGSDGSEHRVADRVGRAVHRGRVHRVLRADRAGRPGAGAPVHLHQSGRRDHPRRHRPGRGGHSGLIIGFPLVIFGCWLAATGGTIRTQKTARRSVRASPRVDAIRFGPARSAHGR